MLKFTAVVFAALVAMSARAQERISLDGAWTLVDAAPAISTLPRWIEVPGSSETALGVDFDGIVTIERPLPLRPQWKGRRVWIEFDAVATHATIACNGTEAGTHLGGWTPFCCELTSALKWDGTDVLRVRVDEKVGHNTQGFLPVIQPHFGGIWQGVRLCVDDGLALDRTALSAFGRLRDDGSGQVLAKVGLRIAADAAIPDGLEVRVLVRDGARTVARATQSITSAIAEDLECVVPSVRPWSPSAPHLYSVEFALCRGAAVIDSVVQRVGFRRLQARGTEILWNGVPLSVRGVLHWGAGEGLLHPPTDERYWRSQIEHWKSLGFNLLKCCLLVPPPVVHELCDELGMLCWQEYPTWHPKLDAAHQQELLVEYGEFFAQDRGHPSVAFRSITCETGHDADLAVVKALFDACHAAVPDTLVVDDSSWIGWQRVSDFWDEHPYGNCRWFRSRLDDFARHIATHGEKPLLLGECIAGDTWSDLATWDRRAHWPSWRKPLCLSDQRRFESWVKEQFGEETMRQIPEISTDFAMAMRRAQVETLRATLPYAGYVVSVASDFAKARMGLCDEDGLPKWTSRDFAWQRDRMLALDGLQRAFVTKDREALRLPVVGIGFGGASPRMHTQPLSSVDRPARVTARAAHDGVAAEWDIWLLPEFDDALPEGVAILDTIDVDALAAIERGGKALLRVGDRAGTLQSHPLWHLRGAPFAPPHPVHASVPARMLCELLAFDLDGGRMIPYAPWLDQVDPILAFWETHDLAEVRAHLLAFEVRIGKGRLLASALDPTTDAGRYVEQQFLRHLQNGPEPRRELRSETFAALLALCTERSLALEEFRFRTDASDEGVAQGWNAATFDDGPAPWRPLRAGSHWENQAEDLRGYTGVAWYRIAVDVPAEWAGRDARLVLEGVDDSVTVWLDGEFVDRRGDPATATTVWLEPQTIELGARLRPGRRVLALRVVDHAGSGGLWRKAFLTTGPTGILRELRR